MDETLSGVSYADEEKGESQLKTNSIGLETGKKALAKKIRRRASRKNDAGTNTPALFL